MTNIFNEIIRNQTCNEAKKIYFENLQKPLLTDAIEVEIKNNKIFYKKYRGPWVHREDAYMTMMKMIVNTHTLPDCKIRFFLGDAHQTGYFNFCRKKNTIGYFLVPNFRFFRDNVVNTKYYDYLNNSYTWDQTKDYIKKNDKEFKNKENKYIFMGGGGGISHPQRVKYFQKIYKCLNYENSSVLYDGYWWSQKPTILSKFGKSGKDFKHFSEYFKYKFPIYIDGITFSDRFRLLLCLNSVPFVCKTNYEEFYSYMLKNNQNYIEFSDVDELTACKMYNENLNAQIINNNKLFINEVLTTKNIINYMAQLIIALYEK